MAEEYGIAQTTLRDWLRRYKEYGKRCFGIKRGKKSCRSAFKIKCVEAVQSYGNYALYCSGSLTIQGTGKLTLTGGKGTAAFGIRIFGSGYNLTVESGVEVTATAGTATTTSSYGVLLGTGNIICRGTLTGKSGKSTATSNKYGSYGVRADAISGTGTVTAIGGEAPNGGVPLRLPHR